MLKGVIFDMDGVLIDSHEAHKCAWRQFLREAGREVSDAELDYVLDGRKREDILRHFLGNLTESQVVGYGRIKDAHFHSFADSIKTPPGIVEFLDGLTEQSIPAAVATSASKGRAHRMLERFGLTTRFAAVVTGSDVIMGKPAPDLFLMAAGKLGITPGDVLVVEDAVAGVQAAKSAGMKCLAVDSNGRTTALRIAGADMLVTDFVGLSLPVLESLFNPKSGKHLVPDLVGA